MDYESWMPDSLSAEDKAEFTAAATLTRIDPATGDETEVVDRHLAAALAWEHYVALGAGAAEQTAPSIGSVSTGSQAVAYTDGGTRQDAARKRAAFHRAHSRPRTVRLGGTVQMEPLPDRYEGAVNPSTEVL